MHIPEYYLYFFKALPDFRNKTVTGYLDILLSTIDAHWEIDPAIRTDHFSSRYTTFDKTKIKQKLANIEHMSKNNKDTNQPINYVFWRKYIKNKGDTEFVANLHLKKYIYFLCSIEPLTSEKTYYEKLFLQEIEEGIIDFFVIGKGSNPHRRCIIGKSYWLYLYEKLNIIGYVKNDSKYKKTTSEYSNPVYNLSYKIKNAFSSMRLPEIETVERLINMDELIIDDSKYKQLLSSYDQVLMDTWGREQFSANLTYLGISLESWLEAV